MISRLVDRQEFIFFRTLYRAAPKLTALWWLLLIAGGLVPVLFAIATGFLAGAVEAGASLTGPLVAVGITFVAMQVINPVHVSTGQNLGRRAADYMNDVLLRAASAPPGIAHLENPELTNELTMARDFDLGITGPPLFVSMSFIADGLRLLLVGAAAACVLFWFTLWAPLVLVAGWGATHWLLKESGVWRDRNTDEVRTAQRHADYAYRLAVDAPAAKEVRLFGLAEWVVERFARRRRQLYDLQWEATRLRERPVLSSLLVVGVANALVFWQLAEATIGGVVSLGAAVIYFQSAISVSAIAFGGLSWALDSSSAPAAAVARLVPMLREMGALKEPASVAPVPVARGHGLRFRNLTFAYPGGSDAVLDGFDLDIEAGSSLAIVGQNGAGKTTLAKLLCRFYDPQAGSIEIDGVPLTDLDVEDWRTRVAAVFQDFVRYELPLRDNVAPGGGSDEDVIAALGEAGADGLADLDTILARGYPGGTDLSGGQWQRIALARAICGVRLGAGVVLLDEPTAQLDVRGEAEIFGRLLEATRDCTTILISHRFSTVRRADRIAVVEHGRVVEQGTHEELMAAAGRYHTMYELQASRFAEDGLGGDGLTDPEGVGHDTLA